MIYHYFIEPFLEYHFMSNALVGSIFLAIGCVPVGIFLMFRKMSLVGDAMSHAILPGIAVSFVFYGISIIPMAIGGFLAGLIVALIAGVISRFTNQFEDAAIAAFYLFSLALGVVLVSLYGSNIDLLHILFGSVLALSSDNLLLIMFISACSVLFIFIGWRALVADTLDPLFLKSVSSVGVLIQSLFLGIVVMNLVSGFQALGTLLSVGLLILPAVTARFWDLTLIKMSIMAVCIAIISSYLGLLLSYYFDFPTSPTIVLCIGVFYFFSAVFGTKGLVRNLKACCTTR